MLKLWLYIVVGGQSPDFRKGLWQCYWHVAAAWHARTTQPVVSVYVSLVSTVDTSPNGTLAIDSESEFRTVTDAESEPSPTDVEKNKWGYISSTVLCRNHWIIEKCSLVMVTLSYTFWSIKHFEMVFKPEL